MINKPGNQKKDYTLSICMIVKNNEQTLEPIYNSIKSIVDEWIVIDTGSTDKTVKIAKKLGAKVEAVGDKFTTVLNEEQAEFLKKFGLEVEPGDGVFNFSEARNYSFSKATKDFVMWLDSDDILVGSEQLKKIINSNLDPKEQVGISLLYQYETDEHGNSIVEHHRERILPNNGTAIWKGTIHEVIFPTEETSYIKVEPQDAYVLHANSHVSGENTTHRNLKNLLYDLYNQGKNPDPRTLYYLGEAFFKKRDIKRAIEFFSQYVELSGWDEEQCTASCRLSDLYTITGDLQSALSWALKSTQFRPDFPSAFIQVAQVYFSMDRFEDCIRYCHFALQLEEPDTLTLVSKKNLTVTPYLLLAESHYREGNFEDSLRASNSALKEDPTNQYAKELNYSAYKSIEQEELENSITKLNEYLRANEEPLKANELMKCVPWDLEESPKLKELKKNTEKTIEHLDDSALYETLYESDLGETFHEVKNLEEVVQQMERVKLLLASLLNNEAKTILDVSCGDGRIPLLLTKLGFHVTALDCSSKAIDFAKEQQRKWIKKFPQVANVEFINTSLAEFQSENTFDCVYSFETIEHVRNPEQFINYMEHHLSEKGFLALSTPNGAFDRGCNKELLEFKPMKHVRVYTANNLKDLLESLEFKVNQNIPHQNNSILYLEAKPRIVPNNKVAILCGQSSEVWGPKSIYEGGCGGSEEAVIYLSKELNKLGLDVTVFNETSEQGTFDGVHWKHHSALDESEKFNTMVIWRTPHFVDMYKYSAKQTYLWLHDVPETFWFTKDRLNKIDKIMVLSDYHRWFLPEIPDEKFFKTQNGVELSQFARKVERNPKKVIYTSSYLRGLEQLLGIWGEVHEATGAELDICYGWESFDKLETSPTRLAWKSKMVKLIEETPGVNHLGRVGQDEVAIRMKEANILAYPCIFQEISCITAMKAQIAGCIPLTSDYGALIETNLTDYKIKGNPTEEPEFMEKYKTQLIELINNPVSEEERKKIIQDAIKKFSWANVAQDWKNEFEGENK